MRGGWTSGVVPSPSPHDVKPRKSWSEALLLLVTLVFTLNIYFVLIRRKLQPIKAKGQWLITSTLLGAYLLFMWTSVGRIFGPGKLVCETGFRLILLTYTLQSGPIFLRHIRNASIYDKARRKVLSDQGLLQEFLGSAGRAELSNNRDAFPKTFSLVRQSSLMMWLAFVLVVFGSLQHELLQVISRGVMVEPAVQCLSEESYGSNERKQSLFWFGFHLLESLLYLWALFYQVPSMYFPSDLLESKAETFLFFLVTFSQTLIFLEYERLGLVERVFNMAKDDMAVLLVYARILLHFSINGLLPLLRSFNKNFQACVDSYVADALDCKQKGKYIGNEAAGGSGSSEQNAGALQVHGPDREILHNANEKIKYLLKDILGLDHFQTFLERQGGSHEDGLGHLLKWYEIETINIKLEEMPGQKNCGAIDADSTWTILNFNTLASQIRKIYNKLEQWKMSEAFDESVDTSASHFLSEAMESDSAHRLPTKVFLTSGDSLGDHLMASPIKRILLSKHLLQQYVVHHYDCIIAGLRQCQMTLLLNMQEHYQSFLLSEDCRQLKVGWMKKHVIACLLIRIRVMNLPSEDSYLDLITKESLQFVVLQTLGFSGA